MSAETKFTQGPWELYCRDAMAPYQVVNPNGDAELGNWVVAGDVRWKVDARLIAAAPDMYAALEDAYELIRGDLTGIEWKRACNQFSSTAGEILAKARGETE